MPETMSLILAEGEFGYTQKNIHESFKSVQISILIVCCNFIFDNSFAQGLHLRQIDMLEDGITHSSRTLTRMTKKLREVCYIIENCLSALKERFTQH